MWIIVRLRYYNDQNKWNFVRSSFLLPKNLFAIYSVAYKKPSIKNFTKYKLRKVISEHASKSV